MQEGAAHWMTLGRGAGYGVVVGWADNWIDAEWRRRRLLRGLSGAWLSMTLSYVLTELTLNASVRASMRTLMLIAQPMFVLAAVALYRSRPKP